MEIFRKALSSMDLRALSNHLSSVFAGDWIEEQAAKSGFIVRNRSGLTGRMFLIMNALELAICPHNSLQDQCNWLEDHFGVHLTKQSLDDRYNTFAVGFMRCCFERLLGSWISDHQISALNIGYGRILLQDSTTWQLPATMSAFYPSKEVSKTGASLKIDYCFDYLSGQVTQLILESGRLPDSKINTVYEPSLRANDLIIKDLGYWNYKQFEQYNQQGIYFLSRLKTDASLYDLQGQKIDLETILPSDQEMHSYDCLLGTERTAVRVCIEKLPESVRLQRLEKLAKSQNWNLSALRIKLCAYSLYVTNTDQKLFPTSLIRLLYGIRWQIEVVFKAWKSVLEIDNIKSMSVFRVETLLYGRLILILLNNNLQAFFKEQIADFEEDKDFELSEMKAVKVLKKS